MERPSHSITTLSALPGSRRIVGVGLSVAAQGLLVAALVGGLVVRAGLPDHTFQVIPETARIKPTPPPPAVKVIPPEQPAATAPDFVIAPEQSSGPTITITPPATTEPSMVTRQPPPAAVPDRAAAGVAATHTVPPYPTLARRLGVEGKVTLRLTVMPDGTVSRAEVTASSGRPDLDQAAQQWIVSHWTYQPAIKGGAPAASQVMAAVEFTLTGK